MKQNNGFFQNPQKVEQLKFEDCQFFQLATLTSIDQLQPNSVQFQLDSAGARCCEDS